MKRAILNTKEFNLYKLSAYEIMELKQKKGFVCPYCHEPVRLKSGPKRRPYFAHVDNCQYEAYENESPQHLMAKNLLTGWLGQQGIEAVMEKTLPHIRRIADIYFEYKGQKYVFEIQKSAISEALFNERTRAYESAGIQVLWLFIGDVVEKPHSYMLNRTMVLNRQLPMFHLQLEQELLTSYSHIVWISTKEIQAQKESRRLKTLDIDGLLELPKSENNLNREGWLAIKQEFRMYKWQAYMRHEKALIRECQRLRTNLSLLPAEVGWPVGGSGFRKYIFIWQAYALMAVASYELSDCFSLNQLVGKIRKMYRFPVEAHAVPQLKEYLDWLVQFGIITQSGTYYEYVRAPKFYERLEGAILGDQQLALKALSPGGSLKRQVG